MPDQAARDTKKAQAAAALVPVWIAARCLHRGECLLVRVSLACDSTEANGRV
jgi:hypothetical protein